MRLAALAVLFALTAAPTLADDAPARVPVANAAQHIGETVTVVGVLTNVHKTGGKHVLWDIGGTYPDNPLTVFVSKTDTDTVPDVTPLIGKTLAITGKITTYQGRPEIKVMDAKQVAVAP